MVHVIAFNLFFVCCLIYSVKYGGGPEKAAILSQAAAAVFTIGAVLIIPRSASFHRLANGLVLIDAALLVSLIWIALRANRLWTIILAGLQLSTMLVHLSKALAPALPSASYAIFAQFWAWPMLITSIGGTLHHDRRVRRYGPERDWKPLWPNPVRTSSTI
jgi:signal transduction histidine kinase